MKIRPKVIAPSQKMPNIQHNGCNGMPKSAKIFGNCTGTPSRSPASSSSSLLSTPLASFMSSSSYTSSNDGCFGSRVTACEMNCNSSRSSSRNSNNNNCSQNIGAGNGNATTTNTFGMTNGHTGNGTVYTNHHHHHHHHHHQQATNSQKHGYIEKNNHIYAYALISLIAIMVYLNGINGEFVHDDIPAIKLNKDVIGTNKITRLFFNDFWGAPMNDPNSHKSYRPLTVLSFRLNYYLFGLKPFWFHFTNILMHAIVCVLFTRVCIIVAGLQDNFAIIAGIIFAIHPIHTEAVTGIVGRADVLACIFFLISLLVYHGKAYSSDDASTWLSILFGGISMLSKETGITIFLVNLTYDLYRCWPSLKRTLVDVHWTPESQQCYRRLSKLLISMVILLIIRLALLQGSFPKFSQQDNPTAYHPSFYVRMLTFCYLAAFNWWLMLCPSTLSHDWQMGSIPLLTSISDPRNLLTLWAFASTILMLHKSILDFETQRYAPLILGVLLLILPFLPASNLFVTVGFVVAERCQYISSLGCVLLVVYGAQIMWETMSKYRSFIILMGILLITVGTCKTITRNRDWYSRERLLRAGLAVLPHNAKMHYNFGNFLKDSFQKETATLHYREALRLWPTYASAHNNLGTLIVDSPEAEDHFLFAIMYASTHVNAHFNLGQLYLKKNQTDNAIRMMKRCIELDVTYVKAHLELFRLHGEGSRGALILTDAIKANPDNFKLRLAFGEWLLNNGLAPAAMHTFQRIFEKNESNMLAITGICKSMRKMGQWSRLHLLMTRLQTIYRLKHGGSYRIDIYLRNWSIRTELQRRAYLYNVENETFHEPGLSATPSERIRNDSGTTMLTSHQLNITNDGVQQTHEADIYQNSSNEENANNNNNNNNNSHNKSSNNNGRDHEQNGTNQKDFTYQKQYCNDVKTIQSDDMMRSNGVNIATRTEINTTIRKPLGNDLIESDSSIKYLCDKHEMIVEHRCGGTWNKNIRNCSEKKSAQDAKTTKPTTTTTTTTTTTSVCKIIQNKQKQCPFNPPTTSEIGKSNKPPKLKTQNTFISRLFLTDILDNI
ncbi:protein O-mannosyl-transferase TMTC1-like isoform X2 [Contarinia nasturtii]|uniref:protein O-mannosyl-transferase TMTC1-like isoform X2 n=1 Tax=Contarinia nasturtii TaxID=265458 RepID=UPI0012D4B6B4|nr:protein O-mannosyl-transferase TMTC1-like isoform X2 [Contarinia nasturtii]